MAPQLLGGCVCELYHNLAETEAMKKLAGKSTLLGAALLLSAASTTFAYTLDSVYAKARLPNSGSDTVLDWVHQATGDNTLTFEDEIAGYGDWTYDSDLQQYFTSIDPATEWFVVKTGNIKLSPTNYDHFLFQNIGELDLAVFSAADFGGDFAIGKISHTRTYEGDTPTASVPEAGSLSLLAAGLLGLAATRRFAARRA